MLQFIIWIAVMIALSALIKAAIATSGWLVGLYVLGLIVCGWFLQTDAEKESVKAFWLKWL